VKFRAVNTLQTGETLTTDEAAADDEAAEVDDPPDQNLTMPIKMMNKKKKTMKLKKNRVIDEKIVDIEDEVEAEVEAEVEVEEVEAEDEAVTEVATKEATETRKETTLTTITPTITTRMPMGNRLKAMPVDLKPDEAVNDHEVLIEAEAEEVEAAEEEADEAEDEAETTTNPSLAISKPRSKLKTKFFQFLDASCL
jgi:hypothetical protein